MASEFQGYALLVGVGECEYSKLSLPVTVKDAAALREILVDPALCGYRSENIKLLANDSATRQGILEGLNWLQAKVSHDPQATAVIFYSGHGWRDQARDYYLLPHDFDPMDEQGSAVTATEFTQALREIVAERLLVIVDSCHAAGMAAAKSPKQEQFQKGLVAPSKGMFGQLSEKSGRAVFLSCSGEQSSWVRQDGKLSVFTFHLLETLRGAGSSPRDGVVKVSHLMKHLGRSVSETAQKMGQVQNPQFKFETEDFAVALLHGGKGLPEGGWNRAKETANNVANQTNQYGTQDNIVGDKVSGDKLQAQGDIVINNYSVDSETREKPPDEVKRKILALQSDPSVPVTVRHKKALREIRNALKNTQYGTSFELQERIDIDPDNIHQELTEIKPNFVYISGDKPGIEKLILSLERNPEEEPPTEAIADFFGFYSEHIECVIFNGSYTEKLSRQLAKTINTIIHIPYELNEELAANFSANFYYQLGAKRTIKKSFEMSQHALVNNKLLNTTKQEELEELLPVLLEKEKIILEDTLKADIERKEENPENPVSWTRLAATYSKLGKAEDADKAYEKASSLKPNDYKIRNKQGQNLDRIGEHEKAIKAYCKAIEIEKADYRVWWRKARSEVKARKYDDASASYRMTLSLRPGYSDNYIILREYSAVLLKLDRHQSSIRGYKKSLSIEPRYRTSNYEKKKAYKKMYQHDYRALS